MVLFTAAKKKEMTYPKWELNRGTLDLKSSTLLNELKRYPPSAMQVVDIVTPTITLVETTMVR